MVNAGRWALMTALASQIRRVAGLKNQRYAAIAVQLQALAEKRLEQAVQDVNDEQLRSIGWSTW